MDSGGAERIDAGAYGDGESMRIGFVGLSHLGIVSSACAAAKGFDVVAYDPDAQRCEALSRGLLPISEPGLPELLKTVRPRLQFTSAPTLLHGCAVVVVSADVPIDERSRSDMTMIHALVDTVLAHAAPDAAVVILSQVSPGFTRGLAKRIQGEGSQGRSLYYQVETLVFGQAVERALHPERIILGCARPKDPLPSAYAALVASFACPLLPMRYESAELAKIAINMFLVSSVSTTNTLSEVCEAIGADWSEIAPALAMDRRIGPHAYLKPGLGLAGGNLERDLATVKALADAHGTEAGVVDAWRSHSAHRRDWALSVLHAHVLSRCQDPRIAVWGLAYKAHTDSTKQSPALALLEALRVFEVRVYDPCATLNGARHASERLTQVASALEACQGTEALAIMTPWPEFAQVNLREVHAAMKGRVIVDPFGVLDDNACATLGFAYARLGRTFQPQELPA